MFQKKLFREPPLYGELEDRGHVKRRVDFNYRAPFFCLFQHRLQRDISPDFRSLFGKKKTGGDDKNQDCVN